MSTYAIATVKGFESSELRVKITRREAGLVWCVTADLRDAGCALTLSESQIKPEEPERVEFHKTGLVSFA